MLTSLIAGLRPRQWVKNILVIAAPLAAGILLQPPVLLRVAIAFVVMCLASSAIYLLNDLLDVEADRAHPKKRFRPIASGRLPVPLAWVAFVVLVILAPVLALVYGTFGFFTIVVLYIALQVSYCVWLKHVVVLDLVIVSSGFLIRAVAGGLATDVTPSQWFLLVTAFGSLFMVAGKRYSEKRQLEGSSETRRSLAAYSPGYLRFVWQTAAGVALVAYTLWAFELSTPESAVAWTTISIIPFAVALLRYAYEIDRAEAGSPEDTVLGDKPLLVLGLLWVLTFSLSVVVR